MIQAATPRLVLASASGTRRSILTEAGLRFEAVPSAVDEAAIKEAAQAEGIPPADAALMLADAKAERIARRHPDALVIGCDQLLVCEGAWFDKPADLAVARAQLLALRGRTHELVTAVVCHRHGSRVWQDVAAPRLTMREFSEPFLDAYLAAEAEHVTHSVGGYRLEGPGVQLFARVQGEHAAILGIPLLSLLTFLRRHGVLLA
ncbi:Maf family protein [Neoroseomonas soli]|uniref:Nucleoside triphosphate pyrophosphatase n=1 Tax=Neoroseomonas soli TaxID=1081025 RepID=A0A9X9X2R7_9PROT|nr:Maf family protein [Neoroseomonas soli]MBR0673696.1 septum formation protein Maf [Neoroseomonas soli]